MRQGRQGRQEEHGGKLARRRIPAGSGHTPFSISSFFLGVLAHLAHLAGLAHDAGRTYCNPRGGAPMSETLEPSEVLARIAALAAAGRVVRLGYRRPGAGVASEFLVEPYRLHRPATGPVLHAWQLAPP